MYTGRIGRRAASEGAALPSVTDAALTAAPPAPPPLDLLQVFEPWSPSGPGSARWRASLRAWCAWACTAVEAPLRTLAGTPVWARCTDDAPPPADDTAFAVRLRLGRHEPPALLTLDARAARLLADAVMGQAAGLRGSGPLTPVEVGLVEYALLECAQHVSKRPEHGSARFSILAFAGPDLAPAWVQDASGVAASFEIAAPAGAGRGALWLPGPFSVTPSLPPAEPVDPSRGVTAGVALPWITLPREQWESLAPGDLLLPGLTGLVQAGEASIVTRTGWSLAPARVTLDSATVIEADAGRLEPSPDVPPEGDDDAVGVRATLGARTFWLDELRTWSPGRRLSFTKPARHAVTLWVEGRPAGAGELVAYEGEVAIRLTEPGKDGA